MLLHSNTLSSNALWKTTVPIQAWQGYTTELLSHVQEQALMSLIPQNGKQPKFKFESQSSVIYYNLLFKKSGVQDQLQLHKEFENNLKYIRPHLKNNQANNQIKPKQPPAWNYKVNAVYDNMHSKWLLLWKRENRKAARCGVSCLRVREEDQEFKAIAHLRRILPPKKQTVTNNNNSESKKREEN